MSRDSANDLSEMAANKKKKDKEDFKVLSDEF